MKRQEEGLMIQKMHSNNIEMNGRHEMFQALFFCPL